MDLLKTQLILKGIISIEEWEDMKEHIQFDYIADNYFTELKEIEIRNERMNQVNVPWILMSANTSLLIICVVKF